MTRADRILLLLIGWPVAAAAQVLPSEPQPVDYRAIGENFVPLAGPCKNDDPAEVVVCGRSEQRYRIDPHVLAAVRAADASPPKPSLNATGADSCVGPNCGGATIPLVGMALTVARAAMLAAKGDDWKEAFRTHPDQYEAYRQSEAAVKGGMGMGANSARK